MVICPTATIITITKAETILYHFDFSRIEHFDYITVKSFTSRAGGEGGHFPLVESRAKKPSS
jgi:hypothetical protein